MDNISDNKGKYAFIASVASSLVLVVVFAVLSFAVNSSRDVTFYSQVDIIAGMIFVFILSMIVAASVWPGIIEKMIKSNQSESIKKRN